jgi:glucosamine--fructose-6-phosphate aminotransferase (isomerizing)
MRTVLFAEILQQPAVLSRLVTQRRAAAFDAAARVRAFDPEWMVIAARGTSDNAARYAQILFGVRHRLTVALAVPSLCTIYDSAPRMRRALVIGISQSGRSPDVISVIAAGRQQGALTLAITNDPGSPLAAAAELCLPIEAGEERAVAATKTYTATLAALAMLSAAWIDDRESWGQLHALPAAVEGALAAAGDAEEAAHRLRGAERFLVLGRGYQYATAHEVALKMKETADVLAEPFSFADLMHGPVALVKPGLAAVLVAPRGRADADAERTATLLEERGSAAVVLTDRPELARRGVARLPAPPEVPEWLSPIPAVVPGQLFAHALAQARGLNPDQPRGLQKVTLTR